MTLTSTGVTPHITPSANTKAHLQRARPKRGMKRIENESPNSSNALTRSSSGNKRNCREDAALRALQDPGKELHVVAGR